ncbi:hypothetical protein [Nocardioides sp. KR10-350]|uniref:hypothetical protein n=1 Tax=Nocardioides cheoyonin TaxID=3156615 RepID=UPI0032B56142
MRIVTLADLDCRGIDEFDSRSFTIAAFGRLADGHVAVAHLGTDGVIGRHDAAGPQALVPIIGVAVVSGADGERQEIGPGRVAVWSAGESHETRTATGLTALVVEGDWLAGPP